MLDQIQYIQRLRPDLKNLISYTIYDDGSTDNSTKQILYLAKKMGLYNFNVIIKKYNGGLNQIEIYASKLKAKYVLGIPGDLRYNIETATFFFDEIKTDIVGSDIYIFSDSEDRRGKLRQLASQVVNFLVRIILINEKVNKLPKNVGLICVKPKLLGIRTKNYPSWGSTPYYKYLLYNKRLRVKVISYENLYEPKYNLITNLLLIKRLKQVIQSCFILFLNKKKMNMKIDEIKKIQ